MTSKNPLGIFDALLERFRLGQYHVEDMKKRAAEEQTVDRSGKSSSLYGMSPGVFWGPPGSGSKWNHPVKRKKK